jgi:hypothetical protein
MKTVSVYVINNTGLVMIIYVSQINTYTIQPGQTMLVVVQDQLPLVTLDGVPYDYQSGAFDSGETYSVDPPSQGEPVEFVDNGKPKKKVVYAPMVVTPKKK